MTTHPHGMHVSSAPDIKPNIFKVLTASFLHISKETRALLDSPDPFPDNSLVTHGTTPGPWRPNLHHVLELGGRSYAMVHANDITPVAVVTLGVERKPQDEGRANAKLIASIPEIAAGLRNDNGHRWLGVGGRGVVYAIPCDSGWFVYADEGELDLPKGVESSFPDDLLGLFRLARHYGCEWLKIDRESTAAYAIQYPADVCGVHLYDEAGEQVPLSVSA